MPKGNYREDGGKEMRDRKEEVERHDIVFERYCKWKWEILRLDFLGREKRSSLTRLE
jgi:hypothetical protein